MPFKDIFSTSDLQKAEGYTHYEKLGVGNSALLEVSDLPLEHDTMYYINMKLTNGLGYENVVSSTGFLVDLTPPLPGLIGRSSGTAISVFPAGCETADVAIPGCVGGVSPRAIDM